jgi:predicted outer membrane repeat protein
LNNTARESGGALTILTNSSPLITNAVFEGNSAGTEGFGLGGGAVFFRTGATPTFRSVVFENNSATNGGAVRSGSPDARFENTSFLRNSSLFSGGAIYNETNMVLALQNVSFIENRSGLDDGGSGGAIFSDAGTDLSVTNGLFAGNEIENFGEGGAIFARSTSNNGAELTLTNVTIFKNVAVGPPGGSSQGGGVSLGFDSRAQIRNTIVWGNIADQDPSVKANSLTTITHSLIEGGRPGGMNEEDFIESSGSNPLFVEPNAQEANLRLLPNSPAVDAGNSFLSNLPDIDLDGNPRIVDGNGDGTAAIDIGAYEFQP